MTLNRNTHVNINFNLETSDVCQLVIILSLTIGGLLWAGFTVAKQNKYENTNVFEDCLSAITDKNISCTENIVDVSIIKINFLEKQIENIFIILERVLSNFIPYYNNLDMHYVYEQLNIIIQLMLNGHSFSLHDYSFLLLLFEFIIAVKVGFSKLYLLWYFIKWKYIIWYSSYFVISNIDVGSRYSLLLLLSFITLIYNVYGPGKVYFIEISDLVYYLADIMAMFNGDIFFFECHVRDFEFFKVWHLIFLLKIWYFIFIDIHWYSCIINSDVEFYRTWSKAWFERDHYSSFMFRVKPAAGFGERYINTETDLRYNIHLLIDYLQGRTPLIPWLQYQNNLDVNDMQVVDNRVDFLAHMSFCFSYLLENIVLLFWTV